MLRILVGIFLLLLLLQYAGGWFAQRYDRTHNRVRPDTSLPPPSQAALDLHRSLLVADLHADPLLWKRDLSHRQAWGQVDLPRLQEGNVGLQVFGAVTKTPRNMNYASNEASTDNITLLAIASGWPGSTWRSLMQRALYMAQKLDDLQRASEGGLAIIHNRRELDRLVAERAAGNGTIGAILSLEGSHALEGKLENVDVLFHAGYRMLGLAHFFDNAVSGSAHGMQRYGLTELGRQVVRRAEALGMAIDASHASPAAIRDLLDMATRPVVFSHTGVTAVCAQHDRNLDDETLARLSANGGVAGIGLWDEATCGPGLDAFFRNLDHAVEVAGIDHVGLGSDFDGSVTTPIDASGWPLVTDGLLRRGYSEAEIRKLMGGNAVRVLGETLPAE